MTLSRKKLKNLMAVVMLLFFSHMASAIPACALSKFNLTADKILLFHNGYQYFIYYLKDPNSPEPYELIAFDDDCNLLQSKESSGKPIGMFEADYVSPAGIGSTIVFLTRSIGSRSYSVDAYLKMGSDSSIGRKASVKPLILDLRSESMMPQFPPTNFPRPNILVCNNGKHDCDIYVYAPRKEKFIKQQSYHCDQPCSIAKIRAEMIQQPKSRIRTKSKP